MARIFHPIPSNSQRPPYEEPTNPPPNKHTHYVQAYVYPTDTLTCLNNHLLCTIKLAILEEKNLNHRTVDLIKESNKKNVIIVFDTPPLAPIQFDNLKAEKNTSTIGAHQWTVYIPPNLWQAIIDTSTLTYSLKDRAVTIIQ